MTEAATKPKAVKEELDPVEEIRRAQEVITKKTDEVKSKLAKQLGGALETLKVLQTLKVENIWADPQYTEYVQAFNIGGTTEEPKARAAGKGKRKGKKGEIKETILALLKKEPMNHSALKTKVQETIGREIANQYQQLDKMVEAKQLKKDKEGIYSLA